MILTKLEIQLGDALFTVDTDLKNLKAVRLWRDTAHFHVDREIHAILGGSATVEIGGCEVILCEGDICLLAPGSSHYPKEFDEGLLKTSFPFGLSEIFTHSDSGVRFSEYRHYRGIFESVKSFLVIRDKELTELMRELTSMSCTEESAHIFRALLALFFIRLAGRIKKLCPDSKALGTLGTHESDADFAQRKTVEEFFQKRYSEDVGIEDLARELCLSVPQTHRVVKRIFPEGFKRMLIKQRIDHALMLIKEGSLTLGEIAERCGYTSYNGFSAAFKSFTDRTPKEYEKLLR